MLQDAGMIDQAVESDTGETPYLTPQTFLRSLGHQFLSAFHAPASATARDTRVSAVENGRCSLNGHEPHQAAPSEIVVKARCALGPDPSASLLGDLKGKSDLLLQLEALFLRAPSSSFGCDAPTTTLPICTHLLRTYFKIASGSFRPRQQEACLSILQGRGTLVVCPTGWGKSLCYLFPMLIHRLLFNARHHQWEQQQQDGLLARGRISDLAPPPELHSKFCLVVSPLLSLMADQAESIKRAGCLEAAVFSTSISAEREEEFLKRLAAPVSPIDVVFVSPERLISNVSLRTFLKAQRHRLAIVCIDEVHCVSRWAYDFRPSFLYVNRIFSEDICTADAGGAIPAPGGRPPYLCLTATASNAIVQDLQGLFSIAHTVVCTDQYRRNLVLESVSLLELQARAPGTSRPEPAAHKAQPSTRTIQEALLEAVKALPKPMIVYVQSRNDATELASYLALKLSAVGGNCSSGDPVDKPAEELAIFRSTAERARRNSGGVCKRLSIRSYHAGLTGQLRASTQRQFIEGDIDVLVATVAFGMGIDKSNLRSVVHAHAPISLENYVQEIGRAGRDGETSYCRVLYNPYDFYGLRSRLWASFLSLQEFHAIVSAIFSNPITQYGEKLMLVPVARIAEALSIAEETVETVLFMLLTHKDEGLRGALKCTLGSCSLGYRVRQLALEEELEGEGRLGKNGVVLNASPPRFPSAGAAALSSTLPSTSRCRKRSRKQLTAAAEALPAGLGHVLAQLQADDPVVQIFRRHRLLANQVEAANEARLSWDDFQFRCQDLVKSKAISLGRISSAFIVKLGPAFADVTTATRTKQITQMLYDEYYSRLVTQVESLLCLFAVLENPTHERIRCAMEEGASGLKDMLAARLPAPGLVGEPPWRPPPCSLTRLHAVSIANDFVEKNSSRLRSSCEAARCLLGVVPKSLIKHGKYAGQLPLSHSWYVTCPYFGVLREFDLQWVLAVLAPHNLDKEERHNELHETRTE